MDTKYADLKVSEDRFRQWGSPDPSNDYAEFERWLPLRRNRERRQVVRKILELASGLSKGAIGHYLGGRDQHFKKDTVASLNAVCRTLNFPLPRQEGYATGGSAKRNHKHLAIVTDLDYPPSPRYHIEVLFRIIRAAERANYFTSVFQGSDANEDLPVVTERILRVAKPDAIVWFRITPDAVSLNTIRTYSLELPCIVIAGARLSYPPPVIGHIFPDQLSLSGALDGWARQLRDLSVGQRGEIVLVSMKPEDLNYSFLSDSTDPSIRNERIGVVKRTFEGVGLKIASEYVPDYSGSSAFNVFRKYPNALGFVCLSDELAVATKHLWKAAGRSGDPSSRIIGFDNSRLAEAHAVSSIGQSIETIGELLVTRLAEFFRKSEASIREDWPICENLVTELSLTSRSDHGEN